MSIANKDVFELRKSNERFELLKNGKPAVCPFQGPVQFMTPHPIDHNKMVLNIQSIPCNSECVFFRQRDNELFLTCTLRTINIKEEKKVDLIL